MSKLAFRSTANSAGGGRDLLVTAFLFLLLLGYLLSFWGQAARLLPAPLDQWHDVYLRWFLQRWHQPTADAVASPDTIALFKAAEAYLLGLALPLVVLHRCGRRPSDVGLRAPLPRTGGPGVTLACLALLPALALFARSDQPWGSLLYEVLELAAMLPEHLLVFGVVVALLLPQRRLSGDEHGREVAATLRARRDRPRYRRLTGRESMAVVLSALVFQLIHFGAPLLETVFALPVGLLFAYVTLFTASIWPALLAHWALNLALMAWSALQHAIA